MNLHFLIAMDLMHADFLAIEIVTVWPFSVGRAHGRSVIQLTNNAGGGHTFKHQLVSLFWQAEARETNESLHY